MGKRVVLHSLTTETEYPNNGHVYTGNPETWWLLSLLRLTVPAVPGKTWEFLEGRSSSELQVQRHWLGMSLKDDSSSCNKNTLTSKKQREASSFALSSDLLISRLCLGRYWLLFPQVIFPGNVLTDLPRSTSLN